MRAMLETTPETKTMASRRALGCDTWTREALLRPIRHAPALEARVLPIRSKRRSTLHKLQHAVAEQAAMLHRAALQCLLNVIR
jgi:hypothetical protein